MRGAETSSNYQVRKLLRRHLLKVAMKLCKVAYPGNRVLFLNPREKLLNGETLKAIGFLPPRLTGSSSQRGCEIPLVGHYDEGMWLT